MQILALATNNINVEYKKNNSIKNLKTLLNKLVSSSAEPAAPNVHSEELNVCAPFSSLHYHDELGKLGSFITLISKVGPQSSIEDIKQTIINAACEVLDTSLVSMFLIRPDAADIERVGSPDMTNEIQDVFLLHGEQYLTDTASCQAVIIDTDVSILAAPMRSISGVTGAITAFYTAREDAARNQALLEVIAAQASLLLSFASSAQRSRGILDDFASDNYNLTMQASRDGLTGLLNHKTLQNRLSALCVKRGQVFSLVMADVDHFKRYNDTYGHQEGDEVLRSVARVLASKVRQNDVAARYGGEEFALIIRAGKKEACVVADRIRQAVHDTSLNQGTVTLSMGIAEYPSDGNSPAEVIEKADRALYKAKAAGRNCIVTSMTEDIGEQQRAA